MSLRPKDYIVRGVPPEVDLAIQELQLEAAKKTGIRPTKNFIVLELIEEGLRVVKNDFE